MKEHRSQFSRLTRLHGVSILLLLAISLVPAGLAAREQTANKDQKKEKKDEKRPEPFKIETITQGMGLYAIGPVSPDRQSILLLAQRPNSTPNLYIMKLADRSIRPPLTHFKLGVGEPQWSPDSSAVAFAAFTEASSAPEIYTLDINSGKLRQMTSNSFDDREPVYWPDGKRLLFTSDESPLPDAAFGILHVASVAVGGGKRAAFTEDEVSTIRPGFSGDGKSVFLVKIDEHTGRHSLWEYGLDGKPERDLTERKFARVHRYLNSPDGSIVLWAQEEPEEQEGIYILDPKSREARALPDPDLIKRAPAVSQDGKLIAFVSPTDAGSQLFICDLWTSRIVQLTYRPGGTHSPVFVSNTEIFFGSKRENDSELYSVDLTRPAEDAKKKE